MLDHAIRQRRLTGSSVAAALGQDPRRDPFSVAAEKKGLVTQPDTTLRMRMGQLFEPAILALYQDITHREIKVFDQTVVHPTKPWMAGTPDAVCVQERRGVDAKLVSWDQRHLWGESADEIPIHIQFQCWWYMALLDYPLWDVAALVGSDLWVYTVERDLEHEANMLALAEDFWKRYIDGPELPPIGASDTSARYLRERFPRNRLEMLAATPDQIELLKNFGSARLQAKATEKVAKALQHAIELEIGDHDGLYWDGGKFTWKTPKDTTRVQWAELAGDLLRSYSPDERDAVLHKYTVTQPGSRRMYFRMDGKEDPDGE
jgi:predicted phage-related endonuclease